MGLNARSHVIKKDLEGSSLSQVDPYVRLSNGIIALFVQGGAVYSEDGKRVKEADFPEWLEGELERLSPETRIAVGLDRPPEVQPKPKAEVQPKAAAPKQRGPGSRKANTWS